MNTLLSGLLIILLIVCSGCTGDKKILTITGVPDQNATELARRYQILTKYLEKELDIEVRYLATVDYSATVTAFYLGDAQLAWFGGLSGVQARLAVPGSKAIAQRKRDARFHTKFIANANVKVERLQDLKGLKFAFGSESSTSGHLMPRYFLLKADVDPETDFAGPPIFSGSHDKTYMMVESGAAHAGALSESVWQKLIESGRVENSKVYEFFTTQPYHDYNWTVRSNLDSIFGKGFEKKLTDAIINISEKEILELFSAKTFVSSENSNYSDIRSIAEALGIIK